MRKRTLGMIGFGAAVVGGTGFGLLARRRAVDWRRRLDADPEWRELHETLPSREHTVTSADGTALHVEVTGPEDAPTIVLVHGYGLGLGAWHYQRRDLADAFRVVAYDQRGHGRSSRAATGDYSVEALGADLAAVLDALLPRRGRAVVCGNSLGGMSVLAFAKASPRKARKQLAGAVLLGTTGSDVLAGGLATTGIAALSLLQKAALQRGHRDPTDLSTRITKAFGFGPDAAQAHVAFVEQLLIETPNTVKADLGPTLTALDLRDAAPLLQVPVLVLVGEADRLTPPPAAQKLADALPDARLEMIPGAGHNAMLEAHEAVTAHLRRFAAGRFAQAA